jgi:hypothetical protein
MKRYHTINESNGEEFDPLIFNKAILEGSATTVNSISGGMTSSYLAKHYPADINIFSLVRIEDTDNLWMKGKDEKTRQLVSDKLGEEFIGTAEMDDIIYTILDLEQFIGQEITWVTGKTFEQVIKDRGDYLPNKMVRYCTVEMKLIPIFNHLYDKGVTPCEMRIGFRPTETDRANNVLEREVDGVEYFKKVIGKSKKNNKWGEVPYRKVTFPLIENNIPKDTIYNYWNDKPVRFAYRNNCVGCVNRQPLMISHMVGKDKEKVEWFAKQEKRTGNQFISEVSYSDILKFGQQNTLFDDDFNECDSGFCGI